MNSSLALLLFAAGGESGGPGLQVFMFQMFAFIAIIYFLMIRPKIKQEKAHKARLDSLKKGDPVVTAGGIVGEIVHIKDDIVTVKSGDTRILVQRERISDVGGGSAAEGPKKP